MARSINRVRKSVVAMAMLAIAGYVVWCGNTYFDPNGPGMMVPVMCAGFSMMLMLTTFAMMTKPQRA